MTLEAKLPNYSDELHQRLWKSAGGELLFGRGAENPACIARRDQFLSFACWLIAEAAEEITWDDVLRLGCVKCVAASSNGVIYYARFEFRTQKSR